MAGDFPTPDLDTANNANYQEAKALSAKLAANASSSSSAPHVPQRVVIVGGGLAAGGGPPRPNQIKINSPHA